MRTKVIILAVLIIIVVLNITWCSDFAGIRFMYKGRDVKEISLPELAEFVFELNNRVWQQEKYLRCEKHEYSYVHSEDTPSGKRYLYACDKCGLSKRYSWETLDPNDRQAMMRLGMQR